VRVWDVSSNQKSKEERGMARRHQLDWKKEKRKIRSKHNVLRRKIESFLKVNSSWCGRNRAEKERFSNRAVD